MWELSLAGSENLGSGHCYLRFLFFHMPDPARFLLRVPALSPPLSESLQKAIFMHWRVHCKNISRTRNVSHMKYYESYQRSKQISYSHTIIDKTVGKVSTFDVFIASLPSPLFNVVQN